MIPCAGAGFKSLSDTWVDRMIAHGRPIPTELGELAEFERKLIPPAHKLIPARTGDALVDTTRLTSWHLFPRPE